MSPKPAKPGVNVYEFCVTPPALNAVAGLNVGDVVHPLWLPK